MNQFWFRKFLQLQLIGVVIPIGRRAEELKRIADFHMKLKEKYLKTCQLDDEIMIDKDQILKRPTSWR